MDSVELRPLTHTEGHDTIVDLPVLVHRIYVRVLRLVGVRPVKRAKCD